jgi:hypothetical protein
MLRFLPLLGFACLAVVGVALASAKQPQGDSQPRLEDDRPDIPGDRCAALARESVLHFHAQFSLN